MEHLDYETLNTLKQVMEDDFNLLIETFTQDSTERLKKLQELIQGNDADLIRRAAHSFKGSSSNIGAQQLSALCAALEKKALAGELENLTVDVARIEQEFQLVLTQLDAFH
ncbi:Hpt domain-containing protein [Cellvibrio mixtus]|uniref:Hpt domain-containing protein n=1 Tax=Cellvibrio mixtus TaxID=39650 RepID=UPI000587C4BB|nr:Hpt domain-containing protein [Cellvibrio mixtus]